MHLLGKHTQLDVMLRDLPAMIAGNAELAMRVAYDTEYGIHNHATEHRSPMALVKMHPKEQLIEGGPYYRLVREYHGAKIHKEFGISLTDYLELPRHIMELLLGICKEEIKAASRAAEKQMQDMRKGLADKGYK